MGEVPLYARTPVCSPTEETLVGAIGLALAPLAWYCRSVNRGGGVSSVPCAVGHLSDNNPAAPLPPPLLHARFLKSGRETALSIPTRPPCIPSHGGGVYASYLPRGHYYRNLSMGYTKRCSFSHIRLTPWWGTWVLGPQSPHGYLGYRGTSLTRNSPPPKASIGP